MKQKSETHSQKDLERNDSELLATVRYDLGRRFFNSIRSNKPISESLHCNQKKETERDGDVKEIGERIEQVSSCSVDTHLHKRSLKRRIENRKALGIRKKLDSSTFECHLENLWRDVPEARRASFTYLDSLWFSLYLKANFKEKVLTWIKQKHIFLKKGHWSLLVFCHFNEYLNSTAGKPCMVLLDSLQMADPRRLEPKIREFVQDIYRIEGIIARKDVIAKIPLLIPKVPQQKDDECGRYVLYFIQLFMEAAPENCSVSDGYPYFMKKDWFTRESFERFYNNLDRQLAIQASETNISGVILDRPCDDGDVIILDS
ncbi:hypothetical protein AKJ16_DCAP07716 [Drosera capensis]